MSTFMGKTAVEANADLDAIWAQKAPNINASLTTPTMSAPTITGGVTVSSGVSSLLAVLATSVTLGNGQYFRGTRNTGAAIINLIGMKVGTDDLFIGMAGGNADFTDTGASVLFRVRASGAVEFPTVDTAGVVVATVRRTAAFGLEMIGVTGTLLDATIADHTHTYGMGVGPNGAFFLGTIGAGDVSVASPKNVVLCTANDPVGTYIGGGILWVDAAGRLKFKGLAGTISTLALA